MHSGAIIGSRSGRPARIRGTDVGAMTVDAELFGDALPTYLTRFIGRDRECAELAELLRSPGVVTVCGVGGAGKTRLAVQVARQLRADADLRVCWVPLATTLDSDGVVPAVAHGLGLSGIGGGPGGQLAAALGSERAVVVLDNCEHVAAGCRALLAQLVADCVDLRVITTSRVPLGLSCERIYGVPALGSASDDGGEPTDAMALFVDRAAGVASGYALTELNRPVLAEICRTLQGSPLAIELAASWIRVLSPRRSVDLFGSSRPHGGVRFGRFRRRAASQHRGCAGQFLALVGRDRSRGDGGSGGLRRRLHPRGGRSGRRCRPGNAVPTQPARL